MDLTQELHDAVDAPPPPRFDLDQLMRQGNMRRARSRVLVGIAAFAAVAMVTVGGYAVNAAMRTPTHHLQVGGQPVQVPVQSKPSVAEPAGEQAIEDRFAATLQQQSPVLHVPDDQKFVNTHEIGKDYYVADWGYQDFGFGVHINAEHFADVTSGGCVEDPNTCTEIDDANGITYILEGTDHTTIDVIAHRTDNTFVEVAAEATTGQLSGTVKAAMIAASHDPGFSMNP
jgi:hypothetical protein